ncbi:hypothetical protein WL21_15005 [Burkholderia ubonensis]|nr:hypothetical protein WJ81_03980 [Burkholderia ubonensis]KVZ60199.1 hypothetical protein WL20_17800 [Burkholderia ubonensis]KVZ68264.1 hypothetical protein WL21_15005 [Burkholderia ubonensis]
MAAVPHSPSRPSRARALASARSIRSIVERVAALSGLARSTSRSHVRRRASIGIASACTTSR